MDICSVTGKGISPNAAYLGDHAIINVEDGEKPLPKIIISEHIRQAK